VDDRSKFLLAVLAGLGGLMWWLVKNSDEVGSEVSDLVGKYIIPSDGEPYLPIFQAASAAYGVPVDLLASQCQQESDFQPTVTNPPNSSGDGVAMGISQLEPQFYPGVNPLDPTQAIPAQAKSMASYYNATGSWAAALACYDWGISYVQQAIDIDPVNWLTTPIPDFPNGAPPETVKYIRVILGRCPDIEPLPAGA
jgi:hypothetical protein